METRAAIRARRAIKHFDPEHRFTDEEKRDIISHAMLAPTCIMNWLSLYLAVVAKATNSFSS